MSDAAAPPRFAAAPILSPPRAVPPEWIDYNGHMNVAFYSMAFDKASDHVFDEVLGIGEAFARERRMGPYVIQQMIHYVGELLEGQEYRCSLQLLDWDAKKLHLFSEMVRVADGALCATSETLTVNVDLEKRRSAPYPPDAMARIEALGRAHAGLARPARAGASVAIRRRG